MHTHSNNRRFGGHRPFNSQPGRSGRFSNSFHRGGGGRRSRFADKKIDVSRYVNIGAAPLAVVAYTPTHTFADFLVDARLKQNILKKGYKIPTPIQDKSIPEILKGSDVVGIANTGTGKTAAFLIPLIDKVLKGKDERILIVAPTRELAHQINEELREFVKGLQIFSVCVVGGSSIGAQIRDLKYFNNFIIGTPGRIKDLMERKFIDLSKFNSVVLDEADRMLDMGFLPDMRFMIAKMPATKHTLFFSATLSPEIEKLIKDFLKNPVRISVKTGVTAQNIEQDVVRVKPGTTKIDLLHELLAQNEFEKVLVFGKTKHGVQRISDDLLKKGFKSAAIHGNKTQSQRLRALNDFKTNKTKVLVATDVAARGLDIDNVSHVINFDIPSSHEDYIHRIGRTGRGDKKGKALTFVD